MNVEVMVSTTPRLRNGFATVALHLPELDAHEVVDLDFAALYQAVNESDPLAEDLVLVAGVCYVLDKCVPRRRSENFWTRRFNVELPVSDPRRWRSARRR